MNSYIPTLPTVVAVKREMAAEEVGELAVAVVVAVVVKVEVAVTYILVRHCHDAIGVLVRLYVITAAY